MLKDFPPQVIETMTIDQLESLNEEECFEWFRSIDEEAAKKLKRFRGSDIHEMKTREDFILYTELKGIDLLRIWTAIEKLRNKEIQSRLDPEQKLNLMEEKMNGKIEPKMEVYKAIAKLQQTNENTSENESSSLNQLNENTSEIESTLLKFLSMINGTNNSNQIPPLNEDYLSIIHNIEVHYGPEWKDQNRKSHQQINSVFKQCIKFGGTKAFKDISKIRGEYIGRRDPFFPSIKEISKQPKSFEPFQFFAFVKPKEEDVDSLQLELENLTDAINISTNLAELLRDLEEYADIKLSLNEFDDAVNCYHFIYRNSEDFDKKQEMEQKICLCETKLILSSPFLNNILFYNLPANNSQVEANKNLIHQVECFVDKLLFSKQIYEASNIYKGLLGFIQGLQNFYRLKRIDHSELDLIGKNIFEKFCNFHFGKIVHFKVENFFKNRLIEMRKIFIDSKKEINDIRKWNSDLIQLLKDIIKEVENYLSVPFKFAVLGIGSIARREACFCSDIDLIIIVDDNYSHSKTEVSYFRKFISLLRLMIMGLGEAETKILSHQVKSQKQRNRVGIHVDPAGFFPLVDEKRENNQSYGTSRELINDMKKGSKLLLCDLGSIQDVILLNEKNGSTVVEGFIKERNRINSENKELVFSYFDKLDQFKLLFDGSVEYQSLNVKKMSRYVVLLMNRIFMYFGFSLEEEGLPEITVTERKIDFLTNFSGSTPEKNFIYDTLIGNDKKKLPMFIFAFFRKENSEKLKEFLIFVFQLRFKCHLFYKEGKDEIYFPPQDNEEYCVLNPSEAKKLTEFSNEILNPLYAIVQVWRNLFPEDVTSFRPKAAAWYLEYGSAEAQTSIEDYSKAMEYYLKAAEKGHSEAQVRIGDLYYHGRSVSKNYEEAMIWYLKAAGQGLARAQFNIGWLYLNGYGVKKDLSKTKEYFKKAADQGDRDAQEQLKKYF